MNRDFDFATYLKHEYFGRILHGEYSKALKQRVSAYLKVYLAFESTGNPAIPYIAAWQEGERTIWYEYAGRSFRNLFDCSGSELPEVFKSSITDQRIYHFVAPGSEIMRQVVSREQLSGERLSFREASKHRGSLDAVYKIQRDGANEIWLKDQARLIACRDDRLNLSLGSLTVVTKEMRSEEERLHRERLEVTLQTAGAVCHELNQPLQAISGYSETLAMQLTAEDPLREKLQKIRSLSEKMGAITGKLMKITRYETKDYLHGLKIIDIDKAAGENNQAQ
jgi:signal transduction histidine kinase